MAEGSAITPASGLGATGRPNGTKVPLAGLDQMPQGIKVRTGWLEGRNRSLGRLQVSSWPEGTRREVSWPRPRPARAPGQASAKATL